QNPAGSVRPALSGGQSAREAHGAHATAATIATAPRAAFSLSIEILEDDNLGHGRRRATVGVSWPGRGDAIRERSAQSARSPSCATRNAPAGVAVPGRPLVDRWIKLRELAHPTPRLSIGGCDESHRHVELARTRISAVPSRPRGVVVPRLERAATVVANTVRGAPVRPAPLHTTAAALGLMALLVLHVGAAGPAGGAAMT